jgi:hypothetical protein
MTLQDVKIYPNEEGLYFVEYINTNNEKQIVQFENELLATAFFNSLFYSPQS